MFDKAITLMETRIRLSSNPPKCPICGGTQVQLVNWASNPDSGFWKCRICKHPFTTGPCPTCGCEGNPACWTVGCPD